MVEGATHLLTAQEQKERRVWGRGLETSCSLPQHVSRGLLLLTIRHLFFSTTFQQCQQMASPSTDFSIAWVTALMTASPEPQLDLHVKDQLYNLSLLRKCPIQHTANCRAHAHRLACLQSTPPSFCMERCIDLFLQSVYTSYHLFIPPHFTKDLKQQTKYK